MKVAKSQDQTVCANYPSMLNNNVNNVVDDDDENKCLGQSIKKETKILKIIVVGKIMFIKKV